MVTDRTANDVSTAKALRKRGAPFTDAEILTLERGTITINTLNRIENKQAEIAQKLNEWGYYSTPTIFKTWTYDSFFTEAEFDRVVSNNISLRKAFFVLASSPLDAVARYYYSEINKLEQILVDLDSNIDQMKADVRECDTFWCGEDRA